jgi:hypothetical protein
LSDTHASLGAGIPALTLKNIAVRLAGNGVLLTFTAQDGREATIDVAQLAERLGGETRAVLLAWCEDRRRDPPTQAVAEQQKRLLAQDYQD